MTRPDARPLACDAALARAFGFLGKRWNGILIGTLLGGPAGFSALRRSVPGISESVLADRLAELAAAGLVRREVHEGPPLAVTYRLTEAGHALFPALEQLSAWAQEHLPAAGCPAAREREGSA